MVILLLLLPFCADAQSVPNGGAITPGQVWTPSQWMNAWQSKLDATAGVSTNGTFNNPTINGGTISGIALTGDVSSATAKATNSTTARSLANRFAQVLNVRDYGAKCDGVTDDSAAFSATVSKVNSNFLSGIYTVIYVPSGSCLLNSAITQFAQHVPGAVIGDGPLKSFIVASTSFTGDLFSWSDAWGLTPLTSGTYPTTTAWNGPTVIGISLVANTAASTSQTALHFYDRNDFALIQDVDIFYFTGNGISIGEDLKNDSVAYMRESRFFNFRLWACGNASHPAAIVGTVGSAGDSTNELSFYNTDIISSNGKGLVINNANTGNAVRTLRFYGLRIESSTDDELTIGDPALSGSVHDMQFYGLQINAVASGKNSIVFTAPSLSSAPQNISMQGNIGGGAGNGVDIAAATNLRLVLGMGVSGTDLTVASSTTVSAPIYIDGNGTEYQWTTSIDSTVLPFLRLPSLRYGDPGGQASVVANIHDGTPARGNTPGTGAVDLQSSRFAATQTASGTNSAIGGGVNNTVTGANGAISGGNQNSVGGLNGFVGAGNNNSATGTRSVVAGGNTNSATGSFSVIPGGGNATDRGHLGAECMGSTDFAAQGDAQRCTYILHGTTSNTSAVTLTSDGNAAGAANCVDIPTLTAYALSIDVMAFDHTTVGNNESWQGWSMKMHRPTNGASTTLVTGTKPSPLTSGTVTGSDISASADTTNGCLALSFTPPTGNTDTWRVVATVRTVQVQ